MIDICITYDKKCPIKCEQKWHLIGFWAFLSIIDLFCEQVLERKHIFVMTTQATLGWGRVPM